MIPRLAPGTLWHAVVQRTASALASGHLHGIDTDLAWIEQDGVRFAVRVAINLERKREELKRRLADARRNPFLPPEPELTVGAIGEGHIGVLNKFNVVPHHLLVVTREFEHQETLLDAADFEALWTCLDEYPSLAFYNGGEIAGASQAHKHLQVVPLPLYEGMEGFPLEPCFRRADCGDGFGRLDVFDFRHVIVRLPHDIAGDAEGRGERTAALYRATLVESGIGIDDSGADVRQGGPYNLLMTREWMLVVPRAREFAHGISINGLGYAGSLFVIDEEALAAVRRLGPMSVLREVSLPAH